MSRIILKDKDGKQTEAVSKQEFDSKINTTNALYSSKDAPYDLHDVLSNEYGNNTLGVINNYFSSVVDGSSLVGNFDSLLIFGGNDVRHAIDIGSYAHEVRISYSVLSPPSARLMMRWILSLGTLLALALEMSAASLLLELGSPPPSRTATLISRPILVNTLARAPSVFSFLRLMLFHLLCPDMEFSSPSNMNSVGSRGAPKTPAAPCQT